MREIKFRKIIIAVASILFVVLCFLFFQACEKCRVKKGAVTGIYYHPAYTSYVSTGKTIVPVYHSEWFGIELNGWGECEISKHYTEYSVCKDLWDNANIGDTLKFD